MKKTYKVMKKIIRTQEVLTRIRLKFVRRFFWMLCSQRQCARTPGIVKGNNPLKLNPFGLV